MVANTKKTARLKLQFVANTDHSVHAGIVAVEASPRRFGLWEKLGKLTVLDPRKDRRRGYSPAVIVGRIIYSLCAGGGCLSDSEALDGDPLAKKLFGVKKSPANRRSARGCVNKRPQASWRCGPAARVRRVGADASRSQAPAPRQPRDIFFDDSQLEVRGKQFVGAAINYNGDLALSWQTLWVGPFLCDSQLGPPAR